MIDSRRHQISDQLGARIEDSQFGIYRQPSTKDDEVEIHLLSPLFHIGEMRICSHDAKYSGQILT
jgi:hypothetical protein